MFHEFKCSLELIPKLQLRFTSLHFSWIKRTQSTLVQTDLKYSNQRMASGGAIRHANNRWAYIHRRDLTPGIRIELYKNTTKVQIACFYQIPFWKGAIKKAYRWCETRWRRRRVPVSGGMRRRAAVRVWSSDPHAGDPDGVLWPTPLQTVTAIQARYRSIQLQKRFQHKQIYVNHGIESTRTKLGSLEMLK